MTVFILEVDRKAKCRTQGKVQCIVSFLRCDREHILDEHVEHDHLVAESLALCNNHGDLAKLVIGADAVVVYQLDDWRRTLLVLVALRHRVKNGLSAVSKVQLGPAVCLDLGDSIGRKQVERCLLQVMLAVLWHIDR